MISNKLANIPDSYFGKTMGRKIEHGPLPLINMAVGIPDGPTPQGIIDHFQQALTIPENQKYGAFHGKEAFKQAIVDFYQRQYNVTLDKEDEVCILYGTKNGLVAVPTCVINPGDYVLLPDPGYTDYLAGVLLADGKPVPLNLEPPHYLPDWSKVDSQIIDKTKLIYLTYPNNPTGSTATKEVFDEAIAKFKGTDTKIVHDFRWEPTILSKSIKDLKVAVIGTGRIGRVVADIFANGYQSDVVAYDPFPNAKIATYVDYKDTIEEAVEGADIVTLHVPATKYNHYLFNAELFKHFKKGAVFVNCARGSLVDTKALLDALDNGVIKGAALDTYEFERKLFPSDQRGKTLNDPLLESLIDREDVILTPHIAFYTEAAVKNLIVDALDATLDVLQTGDTRLRVN
ncbi:TPA: D-lactate dehydrogenase [Staphylococcus aureus]